VAAITLAVASWLSSSASISLSPAIQPSSRAASRPPLPPLSVFSDFDGDKKSDKAELFSSGQHKNIQISFGNSSLKSLSFDTGTADQGKLFCSDVDGDNDEDLFWVSQSSPRKFLFWISDGQGNFTFAKDFQPGLPARALVDNDSGSSFREGANDQGLLCAVPPSDSKPLVTATQQVVIQHNPIPTRRPGRGHVYAPCLSVYHRRGPPARLS
jgi:hypothetical protein